MTPPRIGPMQGVQPAAKAIPRVRDPKTPRGFSFENCLVSLYRYLIFSRPIRCKPKTIMTMPPTILIHGLLRTDEPTRPAVAPRAMKMTDKPMLNAIELAMTALRAAPREPPSPFRWSILTPDISERYPGTSGSTQGDRNDSNPP